MEDLLSFREVGGGDENSRLDGQLVVGADFDKCASRARES